MIVGPTYHDDDHNYDDHDHNHDGRIESSLSYHHSDYK